MACRFEITLPAGLGRAVEAARGALDEVDRLEDQLTVFRHTSEVSAINRRAAFEPVAVERGVLDLLLLCQQLAAETDEAFDVTSGPLSRVWGFLRREGRWPDFAVLEAARGCVGMRHVRLDPERRQVRFDRSGVEVNFGSVGKGWALDRAAARLRAGGIGAALLSAGGSSVLAVGAAPGEDGWHVGIRHPFDRTRRLATLRLRDAALGTSGGGEQYFEHEGRRYCHVIDPRSGRPLEGHHHASAVAASAAVADALATAFCIGGPDLAEAYCRRRPGVMAIFAPADAGQPVVIGAAAGCRLEGTHAG